MKPLQVTTSLWAAVMVACVTLLSGGRASADPLPTCGFLPASPAGTVQHVIWIMMENKIYDQIIGNTVDAPYENQLAGQCGLATNFHGETHPSLPNYIAAVAGDTHGIDDNKVQPAFQLTVDSIFSQTASLPGGWRAYQESMAQPCYFGDSYPYQSYHNPVLFFANLASACPSWDIPMGTTNSGSLASDLTSNTLPAFAFVTPNQCSNTHDCPIQAGDAWLQSWVTEIAASPAYLAGQVVLFITWDEDDYFHQNHVATIVVSPYTASMASSNFYNHYSMLRTTEELLGIGDYLGNAATAASMRSDFGLMPLVPTGVTLSSARATRTTLGVLVRWRTEAEASLLGFNVYRERNGQRVQLNRRLIPARASITGTSYQFIDKAAPAGVAKYWIRTVGLDNLRTWKGPLRA